MEIQTREIHQNQNTPNENLQKSIKEGIQEYDEISNHKNQILLSLVKSNQVDSSIVKAIANFLSDKNKHQFCIQHVELNSILFTIKPIKPQQVIIKRTTMVFLSSGRCRVYLDYLK